MCWEDRIVIPFRFGSRVPFFGCDSFVCLCIVDLVAGNGKRVFLPPSKPLRTKEKRLAPSARFLTHQFVPLSMALIIRFIRVTYNPFGWMGVGLDWRQGFLVGWLVGWAELRGLHDLVTISSWTHFLSMSKFKFIDRSGFRISGQLIRRKKKNRYRPGGWKETQNTNTNESTDEQMNTIPHVPADVMVTMMIQMGVPLTVLIDDRTEVQVYMTLL